MKSIKQKNKLYKKFLQTRNPVLEKKYKSYKNTLTHSIRTAKRLYFDNKLTANKSNLKETWKMLNSIINKNTVKSKLNTIFNLDGKEISDPSEIANKFCDYFTNLGPSLARKIPITATSATSFLSGDFVDAIFLDPVGENEVKSTTLAFPMGKATGYDNISQSSIKMCIDSISKPLTHIINLSLSEGFVPNEMKIARAVPLYRADDRLIVTIDQFQFCRHFQKY